MGIRLDSYKMLDIIKKLVANIYNDNVYIITRDYQSLNKAVDDFFDGSVDNALRWIAKSLRITNYVETVFADDKALNRINLHVFKAPVVHTQMYVKVGIADSDWGVSQTIIISLHEWKEEKWK